MLDSFFLSQSRDEEKKNQPENVVVWIREIIIDVYHFQQFCGPCIIPGDQIIDRASRECTLPSPPMQFYPGNSTIIKFYSVLFIFLMKIR